MNALFLVEGKRTEKKLYKNWIPYIKNQLSFVELFQDITNNNFTIISGNGYPSYFEIIKNAFKDIYYNVNLIDYVFICVDSEQKSYDEKLKQPAEKSVWEQTRAEPGLVFSGFITKNWNIWFRPDFQTKTY